MLKRKLLLFLVFSLLLLKTVFAEIVEIRILHINDFYGFAEGDSSLTADKKLGGASYLAEAIKTLRDEKPSLLLSAGDMIQGDNWANLFKGRSVIELMNAMSFDAMVLGNHEFDFRLDVLKERISEAQFAILGANIEGLNSVKPYLIKEISGVKFGVSRYLRDVVVDYIKNRKIIEPMTEGRIKEIR